MIVWYYLKNKYINSSVEIEIDKLIGVYYLHRYYVSKNLVDTSFGNLNRHILMEQKKISLE